MKKLKALLLENIHPIAAQKLEEHGIDVQLVDRAYTEAELTKQLKKYQLLGIRSRTPIISQIIKQAENLQAMGTFCVGYNQVDLQTCLLAGIPVFNTPYSNTRSVVELTIANIIMLARGAFTKSIQLHQGNWQKSATNSTEIRGKTLGIIGYGNIGSQLSVLAESLGMKVIYYDIVEKLPMGNAQKCHTMNQLLQSSDYVTLHVDGRAENSDLITKKQLKQMKPGSKLLNLSRGFVVDIDDLASVLKTGQLSGAAVDVYPTEPKSNGPDFSSPLQKIPNVILTPHIGGATLEAQENIGSYMADKLLSYLQTGDTTLSINFPQLQLPRPNGFHRIAHIHHNVPGILAQINSILASHKMNIEGQYLKTNEYIGYVITDVNKKVGDAVLKQLKQIDHTIKVRVINGK